MRAGDFEALGRWIASRPRVSGLLAGMAFGLLMALAYPPVWLWGLVFVAPLPLVLVSWHARERALTCAFWCAIGVSPWWLLAHIWVARVSAFGVVPLVIVLSALTGAAVWAVAGVQRRFAWSVWTWGLIWVGFEFLRGQILAGGYAWYFLAHPLAGQRFLAWPAAMAGTYAVSLLVTLPATALVAWSIGRRRVAWAWAGVCLAWVVAGVAVDPWPEATGHLRVGVVQTDVPQDIKIDWAMGQRFEDWQAMKALIAQAGALEPDLIALPEAMSPGWTLDAVSLEHERRKMLEFERRGPDGVMERYPVTLFADELILMQGALRTPIMIGGPGFEGLHIEPDEHRRFWYLAEERYNSVFVIEDGQAPTKRYDKVALTPFGEYMPYISRSDWLEKQLLGIGASGMQFDLDAGKRAEPLEVRLADGRTVSVAAPVCFEATMPSVCRRVVGRAGSAQAMINLTNDGWFGWWEPGREHHMLTARWRCLELGVPMVRVANTGISGAFDQRGRVVAQGVVDAVGREVPGRGSGVAVMEIPTVSGRTMYARVGDVAGWGCLGASAGLVLAAAVRGRSKRGEKAG
ncbi:MAG: apolipoprotein N-acyltransferase [Phycisphaerales bacterium]|nr:apolipoprotein N-acyltransferase [Phycisphaerales bacterium]